ncbi:putative MFS monocarboxylate transporter [Echria macrotheca]|uniref:MFS monocarboxylate transporter n=1 Tax=Echria macrotheca TaxID=438768 RepID=A0AAJ0BEH5_9PEZI|nr:putative MFS monocarboxylate transporter [Echria macrotheca]
MLHSNLHAVLTVFGATLSLFSTVGFLNAFGVFQDYYKTHTLRDRSESDISWIGSVAIFLIYGGAPFSGFLVDRFGPRWLLLVGAVGQLVAVFMTSLCTQYYQFFLAQGILLGASMCILTWPATAVVSRTLPKNRGLAMGIVLGGSSLGGLVWPIMIEQLLQNTTLGFGWTIRVVGFTMLAFLVIVCITVREPVLLYESKSPISSDTEPAKVEPVSMPKPMKKKVEKAEVLALVKNPVFIFLSLGITIATLGLFVPIFYLVPNAISRGLSREVSFYALSALNGASFLGRVIPGHLADVFGHYNVLIISVIGSGIVGFAWTAASNLAGVFVIAVVYGFMSGVCLHMQGTAMGLLMGIVAIATLIGTPIAGVIVSRHGYLAQSMYTGATMLVGGLLLVLARFHYDRRLLASV